MKKSLIYLLIVIAIITAHSQDVVISEYFNSGEPSDEWIELLVIKDNISLVGYSLRDNSSKDSWQGGVTLNNHPLWENMREGTVIVINHRGSQAIDVDKSDGFIEVCAENTTYFTKFMTSTGGLPWGIRALNINKAIEIMQLRNSAGDNVHTLGHLSASNQPSCDFEDIEKYKLARNGSVNVGASLQVLPGKNLSDYSRGFDINNIFNESNSNHSKGLPNFSNLSKYDNSNFWRQLRQPKWKSSKTLTVKPDYSSINLYWTAAMNDFDAAQGYLLVRIPYDDISHAENPLDGRVYSVGDYLGSALVIANIPQLNNSSYTDNYALEPEKRYIYRLYLYRYDRSIEPSVDNLSENARGRSYNELEFAESKPVELLALPRPKLYTEGNKTKFCDNEDVIIYVENFDELLEYDFQWKRFNENFSEEKSDKINVVQYGSGHYSLTVSSKDGSSSQQSLKLSIEIVTSPEAIISNDKNITYSKNDTVKVCNGNDFELRSKSKNAQELIWLKDGEVFVANNQTDIKINEPGTYELIGINQNLCSDTSYSLTLEYIDVNFTATPDPLIIDADINNESILTITNNSEDPLSILKIELPAGFTLVSPGTPMTIGAGKSIEAVIRYSPQQFGEYKGEIKITDGCNNVKLIDIIGKKTKQEETVVSISPESGFDFGILSYCHDKGFDSVSIHRTGNKKVTILGPELPINGINLYHNYSFPMELEKDDTITVNVALTSETGYFEGTINFNYQIEGNNVAQLQVPYKGEVVDPNLDYEYLEIVFKDIPECETSVDSFLVAANNSKIRVQLLEHPTDARVRFNNLPIIFEPGDVKEIPLTYKPKSNNESFQCSMGTIPCKNDLEILKIISNKLGVNVSFEDYEINFKSVKRCDLIDGMVTESSELNIYGGTATITGIEHLPDSDVFTITGLNEGDMFSDNVTLEYSFHPTTAGTYTDSLVFYYDPCNIKKSIQIKGRLIETDYTIQPNVLDFGFVNVGNESAERTFTVTNTGELDMVIDGFANLQDPFIMTVPSVADFPVSINPGGSRDFTFKYRPQFPSPDTIDLVMNISEPCEISDEIRFNARSGVDVIHNITLSIPMDLELNMEESGYIPVYIEFDDAANNNVPFERIVFTLAYNPTVMIPLSIETGEILENENYELFIEEISPGSLTAEININEATIINSGEIIKIKVQGLLGNAQYTDVTFQEVEFNTYNNAKVSVETENGMISIRGECDLPNRLISLDGQVSMILTSGNIITENIELEFQVVTSDRTTIKLYDINGNTVNTIIDGKLEPGRHTSVIQTNNISSGVYYLEMQSGISTRQEKLIIVK